MLELPIGRPEGMVELSYPKHRRSVIFSWSEPVIVRELTIKAWFPADWPERITVCDMTVSEDGKERSLPSLPSPIDTVVGRGIGATITAFPSFKTFHVDEPCINTRYALKWQTYRSASRGEESDLPWFKHEL
jgi:hypothetical protein